MASFCHWKQLELSLLPLLFAIRIESFLPCIYIKCWLRAFATNWELFPQTGRWNTWAIYTRTLASLWRDDPQKYLPTTLASKVLIHTATIIHLLASQPENDVPSCCTNIKVPDMYTKLCHIHKSVPYCALYTLRPIHIVRYCALYTLRPIHIVHKLKLCSKGNSCAYIYH